MAVDAERIARECFDAIERDDIDAFLANIDKDVEFNSLIAEADSRTFRGHAGVREWWEMVRSSLGGVHFEIKSFEQPTEEWALIRVRASGTVSGVEVEQVMWQTSKLRDELCIRWAIHRTEEEARETIERDASGHPSPGDGTA